MAAHDMVVGLDNKSVMVPLSDKRIAEEAEKESKHISEKPMNDWLSKMARTDSGMPRYLEDHLREDHDGVAGNEFLQAKFDEKKLLRSEKP
jgi:hypothetical protein